MDLVEHVEHKMGDGALIEHFFYEVEKRIKEGSSYRDAIELTSVIEGGFLPSRVSWAMAKYQESIHPESHLFQEENIDELALLSMGALWDNEFFTPLKRDEALVLQTTLAESIYLIMRYAKADNALEEALEANAKLAGEVRLREEAIRRVLTLL